MERELLAKMEETSRKQLRFARTQCLFSIIAALCCAVILIIALRMIPVLQGFAQQADVILSNLEALTDHLAQIDLKQTVENLNTLMTAGQTGVAEAIEKLNAIDIETLNGAIEDLAEIIKPLADAIKWLG